MADNNNNNTVNINLGWILKWYRVNNDKSDDSDVPNAISINFPSSSSDVENGNSSSMPSDSEQQQLLQRHRPSNAE